jgi:rSAM/selenodomain-associated transferase 1
MAGLTLDAPSERGCGIAVMAKASIPGRTKTRLVPPLTAAEAAQLNTAFLQDVSHNLLAAGRHANIHGYMAYGPPGSQQFFLDTLPPGIGLIESWYPNFGDCLFRAIQVLLAAGHESAVVLNSDSPTLPTSLLVETAQVLARPDDCAVVGPSTDGGYYLLGLKHTHHRMFEDIDWSTEHVARQTIERAKEIGLPVHRLPEWYDVDDIEALRQLHGDLFEGRSPNGRLVPYRAQRSTALMSELLAAAELEARLSLARDALETIAS